MPFLEFCLREPRGHFVSFFHFPIPVLDQGKESILKPRRVTEVGWRGGAARRVWSPRILECDNLFRLTCTGKDTRPKNITSELAIQKRLNSRLYASRYTRSVKSWTVTKYVLGTKISLSPFCNSCDGFQKNINIRVQSSDKWDKTTDWVRVCYLTHFREFLVQGQEAGGGVAVGDKVCDMNLVQIVVISREEDKRVILSKYPPPSLRQH